eukprot:3356982-Pleurochrysis_carterae.AAC.1
MEDHIQTVHQRRWDEIVVASEERWETQSISAFIGKGGEKEREEAGEKAACQEGREGAGKERKKASLERGKRKYAAKEEGEQQEKEGKDQQTERERAWRNEPGGGEWQAWRYNRKQSGSGGDEQPEEGTVGMRVREGSNFSAARLWPCAASGRADGDEVVPVVPSDETGRLGRPTAVRLRRVHRKRTVGQLPACHEEATRISLLPLPPHARSGRCDEVSAWDKLLKESASALLIESASALLKVSASALLK